MKPPSFEYVKVNTVEAAVAALGRFEGDGRILAGGQSLMPLMNMRMLRPAGVIDVNAVPGLDEIRVADGKVVIGALTRYVTIEHSATIARHLPLVAFAIRKVADRQVRNRGTLGGSLCHADPAAQMPLCALTLGATMHLTGPNGNREVPAEEFFLGPYETAVDPFEMLVAIAYPDSAGAVATLQQQIRRHGDFPTVSVAVSAKMNDQGSWTDWRIGMCGLAPSAVKMKRVAAFLESQKLSRDLAAEAAQLVLDEKPADDTPEDIRATAAYRQHLAPIYMERALMALLKGVENG
jgi:carbon-monoxide dehydrogenase medium subunit